MASVIKSYPVTVISQDIWKEINTLTQENIKNDTLPYLKNNPYPQDMNLANGTHLGDINKINLELNASLNGSKSLEWIFGADAEIIELELNKNIGKDIVFYKNISRDGNIECDAQRVFLLDQFTTESKNKLFEPDLDKRFANYDKETQGIIKTIIHNVIKNIDEYNRGEREASLIQQKKQNIRQNLDNDFLKQKIKDRTQEITSDYDKNQKIVFDHLQNYYLKQLTGFGTYNLTNEQKNTILQSFKELTLIDTPRLAETLTNSFLLTDRKTHYEFTQEKIFSEIDKNKELQVVSPEITKKQPAQAKISKDKLRDRDRTLRPQHTRGRQ